MRVLVVCTAGSDRSPAIAARIREAIPEIEVEAAGVSYRRTEHNQTMHIEWYVGTDWADLVIGVERKHVDYCRGAWDILRPGLQEIVLLGAGGTHWRQHLPRTIERAVRIVRRRMG